MNWGGRFSSVVAVALGTAAFSASSSAFQLNPEDKTAPQEKVVDSRASAAPVLVSGVSRLEPAFEKRIGNSRQVRNVERRPEATAPPIRLLPGISSPGSPPPLSPTTVISSAAVTSSLVGAGAPNPTSGGGVASITGVRLGHHSDKTRIVLDISDKADFSYGISESGTSVIVNFSRVDWRSDQSSKRLTGVVAGYSFDKGNKGEGLLGIKTRVPVNIQKVFVLPPTNGSGYRIVLDLTDVRAPEPDKP